MLRHQGKYIICLFILMKHPITIAALSNRAENEKTVWFKFVVVDYIQLMRSNNSRFEGRVQEISEITGLKALAKELNIPLIALSQLSEQ